MPDEQRSRSLDVLGIKPVGEAVKAGTNALIEGAAAFLGRICLPAAEEYGLLLRDRVRHWRAENLAAVVAKAEKKSRESELSPEAQAHPRIVSMILENGSWQDDEGLQDLWAGLLTASCEVGNPTDANLVFVQLLSQMTPVQARVLEHACLTAQKELARSGLIHVLPLSVDVPTLQRIAGITDIHRLDLELDHLRSLELITTGFTIQDANPDISPTPLAVHLYARCKGCRGSGADFFGLKPHPTAG
jgi:hypothetical protein